MRRRRRRQQNVPLTVRRTSYNSRMRFQTVDVVRELYLKKTSPHKGPVVMAIRHTKVLVTCLT